MRFLCIKDMTNRAGILFKMGSIYSGNIHVLTERARYQEYSVYKPYYQDKLASYGFNKTLFDKHFIDLAEHRDNQIEEILNG